MDVDPRCPDCGVTMERTEPRTNEGYQVVLKTGEKRGGLLGALGMKEQLDLDAWLCEHCGKVEWYANVEE